jgi:hypothetical protein
MFPNLNEQSIEEIFDSGYFDKIANTWNSKPLFECARQCGNFDKLRVQFRDN